LSRQLRRTISLLVLGLVLAAISAAALAMRHPGIDPIAAPDPAGLDPDLVDRGRLLATFGGCAGCHEPAPRQGLTGGVRLETPFGAIYSTNITPHPETGIGTWSEAAFRRAMREGVDRTGGYLYPAFPFDHYTEVSDEDIAAIYAFVMAEPPRAAPARASELDFPFSVRPLMAAWALLFHEPGPYRPDPDRDAIWNRGAYLVEGLGHCAACHSPRNALGARDRARDYAGGLAEGWLSPALDHTSPAPIAWTEDALVNYLYDGWDEDHGIAAGPMKDVITQTGAMPEDDVRAIAVYLLSLQDRRRRGDEAAAAARAFATAVQFGAASPPPPPSEPALARGHAIFEQRCANCHRSGSQTVPLALATALAAPDPGNFIRVTLDGVTPGENAYFVRPMPGFPMLGDDEVADLAAFSRSRFSNEPPWTDVKERVSELRASRPAPGR
jgi:mono/diheme cytochrome c family protein